jgi:hypothetical protein
MRHHAVVGLMFVWLATADAGAQPILSVEIDPASRTATITATTTAPNAPHPDIATTLFYTDGITLLNFFSSGTTTGITDIENATYGLVDRNLSAPGGIRVYPANSVRPNEDGGWLVAYDVWQPITAAALPENVTNSTSNLNLYALQSYFDSGRNTDFSTSATSNFGPDSVFQAGTAVRITFPTSYTFSTNRADYASNDLKVYAGYNQTYSGQSYLGTYELTVVPEPSTYAAIAGGLGLAAAVIHRRRQRAKAAQA